MIRVYYWPRELRMVIKGHAVQGEKRYPLVCAAASALFYSLCSATDGFRKVRWCKGHYHLEEKGIGYARIWSRRRYFKRCRVAMGMCVGGLMMLANEYPEVVRVEVCTGIPFDDDLVLKEHQQGGVPYLQKFVYDMTKNRPLKGQKEANHEKNAENAT